MIWIHYTPSFTLQAFITVNFNDHGISLMKSKFSQKIIRKTVDLNWILCLSILSQEFGNFHFQMNFDIYFLWKIAQMCNKKHGDFWSTHVLLISHKLYNRLCFTALLRLYYDFLCTIYNHTFSFHYTFY